MNLPFDPEILNGVGVVGFLLLIAFGVKQGWLILGIHHRETVATIKAANAEVVAAKDQTISELREGRHDDKEIIQSLTQTVSEWDVAGKLQTHILDSIRQASIEREAP